MQSTVWEVPQAPDAILNWMHGRLVGARHVEQVTRSQPDTIEVVSAMTPGVAILGAILLFPIGLLFLLARRRVTLRVWAEAHGKGTRLHIDGATAPGLQKALVDIWHSLEPNVQAVA